MRRTFLVKAFYFAGCTIAAQRHVEALQLRSLHGRLKGPVWKAVNRDSSPPRKKAVGNGAHVRSDTDKQAIVTKNVALRGEPKKYKDPQGKRVWKRKDSVETAAPKSSDGLHKGYSELGSEVDPDQTPPKTPTWADVTREEVDTTSAVGLDELTLRDGEEVKLSNVESGKRQKVESALYSGDDSAYVLAALTDPMNLYKVKEIRKWASDYVHTTYLNPNWAGKGDRRPGLLQILDKNGNKKLACEVVKSTICIRFLKDMVFAAEKSKSSDEHHLQVYDYLWRYFSELSCNGLSTVDSWLKHLVFSGNFNNIGALENITPLLKESLGDVLTDFNLDVPTTLGTGQHAMNIPQHVMTCKFELGLNTDSLDSTHSWI